MSIRKCHMCVALLAIFALAISVARAGVKHSHVEDFTTTTFRDAGATTAWWDTEEGKLALPLLSPDLVGACALTGDALDIAVDGNFAYVAAGAGGLRVVDIAAPESPSEAASYPTPAPAVAVLVDGNFVYLAVGASGLQVVDVLDPRNPNIAAYEPTHAPAEDLALFGDYLLVAAGTGGVEVYDVTNPRNPVYVDTVHMTGTAHGVLVSGIRAYVASGPAGVYVLDLRIPTSPGLYGWCDTPGDATGLALVGDCLFVADGASGVAMLDVANPAHPAVTGSIPTAAAALRVALDGERLHVTEGAAGMEVFDCRDPASPVLMYPCETPGFACGIDLDGAHAFVGDGAAGMCVIRANELIPPKRVDITGSAGDIYGIAVHGDYLYVPEWGPNRVRVLNISNPERPVHVGYVNGVPAFRLTTQGDHLFVASYVQGMRILDISTPAAPTVLGACMTFGYGMDLALVDRTALVADYAAGLTVVDITDPTHPARVRNVGAAGRPWAIEVAGDYAFVVGTDPPYLTVYDIRDPRNPVVRATRGLASNGFGLAISGDHLYVASYAYIDVYNISNPENPALVQRLSTSGYAMDTLVDGDRLYVANYHGGVLIFDIRVPSAPSLLAMIATPSYRAYWLARSGDHLFFSDLYSVSLIRVSSARYLAARNLARSTVLDDWAGTARKVRFACETSGLSIAWQVSADNGLNWQSLTPNGLWTDLTTPGADLLWKSTLTLDDRDVNPTCTSLQLDWMYEVPIVDAITDIPLDEGRRVRVAWSRNIHDFTGSAKPITQYAVYRRIDYGLESVTKLSGEALAVERLRTAPGEMPLYPPGDWDFVTTVPARCEDKYAVVVPTLTDSTLTGGPYYTTFFVSALTGTPGIYFDSPPDSGCSVDNLPPLMPGEFFVEYEAGGVNRLTWEPVEAPDLLLYRIHRAETPEFDVTPENLVQSTRATEWADELPEGWRYFYAVAAMDSAGNVGEPAHFTPEILGTESAPARFALLQNAPNPFAGATTIRFAVPEPVGVSLAIFDLRGRLVRSLAEEPFPAGEHACTWDGRSDDGRPVAPGMYFYRMIAGDRTATRRLLMLER